VNSELRCSCPRQTAPVDIWQADARTRFQQEQSSLFAALQLKSVRGAIYFCLGTLWLALSNFCLDATKPDPVGSHGVCNLVLRSKPHITIGFFSLVATHPRPIPDTFFQ